MNNKVSLAITFSPISLNNWHAYTDVTKVYHKHETRA